MIDDEELRTLYKVSSEEHIQKLEAGILHLEKYPDDQSPFEDLMREAHSLKGDSRMLGVNDVEKLSHQIEHILGQIQRKEVTLDSNLSDRVYHGLDAIRKLVQEAVTGEPSGINTFHILAHLMSADAPPPPTTPKTEPETLTESITSEAEPGIIPEIVIADQEIEEIIEQVVVDSSHTAATPTPTPTPPIPPSPRPPVSPPAPISPFGEPYRIDTIRVETRHLDALMTQTGELTVTKIRIAHGAAVIEELNNLWEELKASQNQKHNLKGITKDIKTYQERFEEGLKQLRGSSQENYTRLEIISDELEEKVRTLRLLPLSTIFQLFPRMVRDLARQQDKDVDLIIEGGETAADKHILEEIKDPLMHLIRNAIDHGLETPEERHKAGKSRRGTIWLKGYQTANNILIEVKDDGKGLDLSRIKAKAIEQGLYRDEELATMTTSQIQSLIFTPGFSTRNFITEVSGRGVGLDVVHTNVERLKGNIHIESTPGQGCTFRIQLGTTLATANVLLVNVQGITHALPIEFVETTLLVSPEDIFTIEGRETIVFEHQAVSVANLSDLLELRPTDNIKFDETNKEQAFPCILLNIGEERLGLFVDSLLDTQDVVIKPQSQLLKRVRNVTGATILGTGEVCMILNPQDLLKSVQKHSTSSIVTNTKTIAKNTATPVRQAQKAQSKPVVLLAEDSIATRTQEKRILEAAGYEVVTAVDGVDSWNKLQTRNFDAVVSDIQMPNLDGLGLTIKIRQQPQYNELPIILVTSLTSDEDKKRGADAGANAYITKDRFNQDILIETLKRLV